MRFSLGVVSYLNARPLVHTLERDHASDFRFVYEVPSRLARLLADGEVDAALVPAMAYLAGVGDLVVPDVSISSLGPVGSVKLLSKLPLPEVRTLATDESSRTSAALAQLLLTEVYGVRPRVVGYPPDVDGMLSECDAAVIIGDAALAVSRPALAAVVDLGKAWWEWQRTPLVLALWAVRAGSGTPQLAQALRDAKVAGLEALDEVAADAAMGTSLPKAFITRYLITNINYDLGPEHIEGLERFRDLCVRHGLLPDRREIAFVDVE